MSKRHINVENLSDAELVRRLHEYGVSCGPVIDQTRRVYQKKLKILMTEGVSSFQDTTDSAQADYEDEDFDEEDDGDDGEYYDLEAKRAAKQHQESSASDISHVHQGSTTESSPGLVRKTRFPVWLIVLLLAVVAFLIVAVISNMEPGYSQPAIGSDSRKNIA